VNLCFNQPQLLVVEHHSIFNGIPILEQAQGWFEDLWNWVTKAAYGAAEQLLGFIEDFIGRWNPTTGRIEGGVLGWLWDALSNIGASILSFCQGLWNNILSTFNWLSGIVWGWVDGALKWLSDSFNWVHDRITDGVTWVANEVKTAFDGAVSDIAAAFGSAFSGIGDAISSALAPVGKAIGDAVSVIASAISNALAPVAKAISDALTGLWKGFTGVLSDIWTWLTTELPAALGAFANFIKEDVITPIFNAMNWIFQRICDTVHGFINDVANLFKGHPIADPADALGIGVELIVLSAAAGGILIGLLDAGSTEVEGCHIDLSGVKNYITRLINPSLFTGAVIGVLVGVGVRAPLRQFYRRLFRPEIPDISTATRMLWRGDIDENTFKDIAGRWGFGDPFEAAFLEMTKEVPRVGDVLSMARAEAFDDTVLLEAPTIIKDTMAKSGFSADWANRFYTTNFEPLDIARGIENFWRGNFTEDKLRKILEINHVHPMWQDSIVDIVYRPPNTRVLRMGLDAGFYSFDDLSRFMRWGGLSPDDATTAAKGMLLYRTHSDRTALRTQAIDDYVAGLDTEDTLRSKLLALQFPADVVDMWVANANYRFDRDNTVALIKVEADMYVKGYTTIDDFDAALKTLGVVDEKRPILEAQADEKKKKALKAAAVEKTRAISEATIMNAFSLGFMDLNTAITRLIDKGYTKEDATLMLQIQQTPKPLSPTEIQRRKDTINNQIAKLQIHFDYLLTTHDAQVGEWSDLITYLSGLPMPPATEIERLNLNIAKAATDKQAIITERDAEITDLQAQLALLGGAAG
jgi:hypothetical protein